MTEARQPVDYPDRLKNLWALLGRLQLSQQQLQAAMANFPPNFDRAAFVAAWHDSDPGVRNSAQSVRTNADDIHNSVVLLLNTAGRTARSLGILATRPKESMLDALQREGKMTQAERDALDTVKSVRDRSQHEYFDLDPGEVHDMVVVQTASVPGLISRTAQWVNSWPSPDSP